MKTTAKEFDIMKEILIFLGGATLGSTVAFFVFALLAVTRLRDGGKMHKEKQ